jgi:hypothetical protein
MRIIMPTRKLKRNTARQTQKKHKIKNGIHHRAIIFSQNKEKKIVL